MRILVKTQVKLYIYEKLNRVSLPKIYSRRDATLYSLVLKYITGTDATSLFPSDISCRFCKARCLRITVAHERPRFANRWVCFIFARRFAVRMYMWLFSRICTSLNSERANASERLPVLYMKYKYANLWTLSSWIMDVGISCRVQYRPGTGSVLHLYNYLREMCLRHYTRRDKNIIWIHVYMDI